MLKQTLSHLSGYHFPPQIKCMKIDYVLPRLFSTIECFELETNGEFFGFVSIEALVLEQCL